VISSKLVVIIGKGLNIKLRLELMKWSMDHMLTWGYMSKKDIAISSEWGNRRCTHFITPEK
jgi:hypothetical protein